MVSKKMHNSQKISPGNSYLDIGYGLPDQASSVDFVVLNVGPEDGVRPRLPGVPDEKVDGDGVLEAGEERPRHPRPEVDRPDLAPRGEDEQRRPLELALAAEAVGAAEVEVRVAVALVPLPRHPPAELGAGPPPVARVVLGAGAVVGHLGGYSMVSQ